MRAVLTILFISGCYIILAQQRPFINSIDKTSATVGETITITGTGFSATPANLRVFFGEGEAAVTSSTTTQIKATVPGNAGYGPITVIDVVTGLSGSSSQLFTLSYDGGAFAAGSFDALDEFATGNTFAYDLCLCDFDEDGLLDAGVTHRGSQTVSFFENQSDINNINFTQTGSITIGDANFRSTGIDCADLDGDGLPDVVFASNIGNNPVQIYFYENTSAGSIAFTQRGSRSLPMTGQSEVRTPRKLKLADIDGDGKKDLVIGSESDNSVFIYLNTYSGTNISFSANPIRIAVNGLVDAGNIDVKDLNNDNLPDLAVIAFDEANQPLAFLRNTSSPGNVSFTPTLISVPEQRNFTFIGDLNNDSYPEIITSNSFSSRISIFENTTSQRGGNISFNSTPVILSSVQNAWGISMGDMNGDGLPDLVVASGVQGIRVFINTTDGSNISFANPSVLLSTSGTEIARNLKIGDLNGDARPDVAFTYNSTSGAAGKLAAFANRNCYEPVLEPIDLTFCPNNPFTLFATKTLEATYNWSLTAGTGTITPNGDEAEVEITAGATATVEVTIVPTNNGDGSCTNTTSQVFTITGSTPPTAPGITPSQANVVCSGETNFTLTAPAGLDNYFWTLPDGSAGTNANVLTIPTLTADDAGVYSLRTQDGAGCVSVESSYEVIVNEPPFININNTGEDDFCDGTTITLEVPNYPGFNFSWEKDGDPFGGTANTQDVTETGAYVAIIEDGCENKSLAYNVTAVPEPESEFTTSFMGGDTFYAVCLDVSLDFTATSTGETGYTLAYDWDFGDLSTGSGAATAHTYNAIGDYLVTLSTSYADISNCSKDTVIEVSVLDQAPGDIPFTVVDGITEKCPSDSILVELPQNYVSYLWSTGATGFSEYAKTRSSATEVTLEVDVVTDIGCAVTAEQTISNFANSGIGLSADETILNDTIDLPEGIQEVVLTASNSTQYTWTIDGETSSITGNQITLRPTQRETIVTVTGIDPNGCEETTEVTVLLPAILPRKTFSPNNDGLGFDCWEILNTSGLQGCTVYIFDNRGRHLLVTDSPYPDNCVWDGNADGQPAPEGIYYFVMKCNDGSLNQTGSITLAR